MNLSIIPLIPKVELHLHLEAAFPIDSLFRLMKKNRPDIDIQSIEQLEERLIYQDFEHFINVWTWKSTFFLEEEDFEETTYDALISLSKQNVKYVEVFYSPGDFWPQKLLPAKITEYILRGAKRANIETGIRCHFIVDLIRDHGPETGMKRLEEIEPFLGSGVIGIGIGGSEQLFPAELHRGVYQKARSMGFRLTAHAGEVAGARSIWSAINDLNAERIGHGLRAYEDPLLLTYLKDTQIPLEMCPISNLKTKAWNSTEMHPIRKYFDQGLLVTVNTDDPVMFNTSINKEYEYLAEQLNFSIDELEKISFNGIEASFLSEDEKQDLRIVFSQEWAKIKK
jgi:adenosine deaminase